MHIFIYVFMYSLIQCQTLLDTRVNKMDKVDLMKHIILGKAVKN